MDLELVGFDPCPFVPRALIALLAKGAHRVRYVDGDAFSPVNAAKSRY